MAEIYFPSCVFRQMAPDTAKAIRAYLSGRMPAAACCRVDKLRYERGSTALYICQACRETLEERAPGKFRTRNLVEYMLEDPAFAWPEYSGMTVTVQDCWRDREHPEIFAAVREALRRMKIGVTEMEENRENTVYCGNLHFEPKKPENVELLRLYRGSPLYALPEDVQLALMREQAEKYPCDTVVTYCNRCTSCIRTTGTKAIHLMELAMGTYKGG